MSALKMAYQSVFRVVSLDVCSASKKQVALFGISVQWDSQIWRQIMEIFGLENLPNWDSTLDDVKYCWMPKDALKPSYSSRPGPCHRAGRSTDSRVWQSLYMNGSS